MIPRQNFLHTPIDERWISIKEKMQQEGTKANYFLDITKFLKVCNELGLKEKREQKNVIDSFK